MCITQGIAEVHRVVLRSRMIRVTGYLTSFTGSSLLFSSKDANFTVSVIYLSDKVTSRALHIAVASGENDLHANHMSLSSALCVYIIFYYYYV